MRSLGQHRRVLPPVARHLAFFEAFELAPIKEHAAALGAAFDRHPAALEAAHRRLALRTHQVGHGTANLHTQKTYGASERTEPAATLVAQRRISRLGLRYSSCGMPGTVFVNTRSGRRHTSVVELLEHFQDHKVEETPPSGLADAVKAAVSTGADFIGVAGGDGTIRGGAEPLLDGTVSLLAVPAGTRNHFAHQLGIRDLAAAVQATSGMMEAIDVGEVNGRCFINNSAIGMYPELVDRREAYQSRGLPKRMAQALADAVELLRGHRFDVAVDGTRYRAWLVFVGNGHYGDDAFDIGARDTLNQHVLDVRVLRGDRLLARLRLLLSVLLGRLHRSRLVVKQLCTEVTVDLAGDDVEVALDGEVETLSSPLRYRSRAGALKVLVPTHDSGHRPHVLRHRHVSHQVGEAQP